MVAGFESGDDSHDLDLGITTKVNDLGSLLIGLWGLEWVRNWILGKMVDELVLCVLIHLSYPRMQCKMW